LNVNANIGKHAQQGKLAAELLAAGSVLGLLQQDPDVWLQGETRSDDAAAIEDLIARRIAAKQSKDFAEADRIRNDLAARGIVLEDKPGGKTEWRRAG
jgi:cysteinyl-tRNA synthetase